MRTRHEAGSPESLSIAEAKVKAFEFIDEHNADLLHLSHDIHGEPELGLEEHYAVRRVRELLLAHGVEVKSPAYGFDTAFEVEAGGAGPRVALLCEYDALESLGHACGHNVIAAAGVGAWLAAARLAEECRGRAVLLGCPAEETTGGKVIMASRGAFEKVDAALMVHPGDADCAIALMLALKEFEARYEGKEAHAAEAPWEGRNALDAAVLGYNAVAALRQHIKPGERVHGVFGPSGEPANVVPGFSTMHWMVRAPTWPGLEALDERVCACLEAGAMAAGCACNFKAKGQPYYDVRHNLPLAKAWQDNMRTLHRDVVAPDEPAGSTDIGNVSYLVPAIHAHVQAAPKGTKLHTREFVVASTGSLADEAVLVGAKSLAMTVIDFWLDASLRTSAAEAFRAGPLGTLTQSRSAPSDLHPRRPSPPPAGA